MGQRAGERSLVGFTLTMAVAMAVATMPLNAYGVLSPFLVEAFAISRSQLGLLITGTTGMAALQSLFVGRVTDALGGRTMLAVLLLGGAALLVAMSAAPTFAWLVVAALVAGFANAAGNPVTNRLIGGMVAPGHRGLIMGVKQSGVQGGLAFAGVYLPAVAVALGWRVALASTALIPLLGLLGARRWVPAEATPAGRAAAQGPEPVRYRTPGGVRWLASYAFLMGAGQVCVVGFLPLYAHEVLGWSPTLAGATAGMLGVLGVVFRIVWGRASERAARMTSPLMLLSVIALCAVGLILGARTAPALVWPGVLLAGGSIVAWNAVVMLAVLGQTATQHTGRASGVVNAGFMGGMAVSPVLFGWSVDVSGGYMAGWLGVMALLACALAAMVRWRRSLLTASARQPA